MRYFRRHADAFAERRVRVDGFADVHGVSAHLDGQRDLADHVAGVGADHAAAEDLAVTVGLWAVVKQQFGHAFVTAVGNGAAGSRPGEQAFFDLDALGFGLVLGQADPCDFWVGVGDGWDDAGVEGCAGQVFVALQFTSNHFRCHMRFMHGLVRQHGLAHDVANGEDVRHVGAHLDVDGDEVIIRPHRYRHLG